MVGYRPVDLKLFWCASILSRQTSTNEIARLPPDVVRLRGPLNYDFT